MIYLILDLHMLFLLQPVFFLNLVVIFQTLNTYNPLVLSRFYIKLYVIFFVMRYFISYILYIYIYIAISPAFIFQTTYLLIFILC